MIKVTRSIIYPRKNDRLNPQIKPPLKQNTLGGIRFVKNEQITFTD